MYFSSLRTGTITDTNGSVEREVRGRLGASSAGTVRICLPSWRIKVVWRAWAIRFSFPCSAWERAVLQAPPARLLAGEAEPRAQSVTQAEPGNEDTGSRTLARPGWERRGRAGRNGG